MLLAYGAAAPAGDPHFASVTLLLLGNGTNGSTTIVDSSSYAHTITLAGDTQISTSSPKFGSGALLLDGTGDWLTTPSHASFEMIEDFTVDFWIKTTKTGLYCPISGNHFNPWVLLVNHPNSGSITFFNPNTDRSISADTGINDGAWNHFAMTRDSSDQLRFYLNGVCLDNGSGLFTSYAATVGQSNGVMVGTQSNLTSRTVDGGLDCVRITNGVARWTGDGPFTPPASEDEYLP